MKMYHDKSVEECKELCVNNPKCKAIEYGVSHGGAGTTYKPRDCDLQSGSDKSKIKGCDGARNNLDLYVPRDCAPVPAASKQFFLGYYKKWTVHA